MPEAAAGPWPANATFGSRGLSVAGVTAEGLARRYGTPLLVADEAHLRERARTFARLFPHPLYAVKAFTSHELIRLVAAEGLDLLAATDGELEACLRAGIPASRIVLHGNTKTDAELALAVRAGVRLVNVDKPQELGGSRPPPPCRWCSGSCCAWCPGRRGARAIRTGGAA
jgi:diaminopimelate decarboxylase